MFTSRNDQQARIQNGRASTAGGGTTCVGAKGIAAAGAGAGTKIGAGHKPQAYDAHGRYTGPNVGAQGGSVSMRDGLIRMYARSDGGADENDGGKDQSRETGDASLLSGLLLAENGRAVTDAGGGQSPDNEAWRLKEKQFKPEQLVKNAQADLGSDKWYPRRAEGEDNYQCNVFVADKLKESGAHVPNVGGYSGLAGPDVSDYLHKQSGGRIGGHVPSASDWHKGNVPGYEKVTGVPQPGDVATNGTHVGIVSGTGKTISVTSRKEDPRYGTVVENDWGFRATKHATMTFWRCLANAKP